MIKEEKIKEIEALLNSGLPVKEIASAVGVSITTTYSYKKLLRQRMAITESKNTHAQEDIPAKLIPYRLLTDDYIRRQVFNASKIYQDLKERGFSGSYSLINKYFRKKEIEKGFSRVRTYQKVESDPGEQAQVDWGHFGKIKIGGETVNLYAFVYVLSYSRAMYAEFVTSQKQQIFQECHIHAFNTLGAPKKIRYDNIKTVVTSRKKLSANRYDIRYNFDFLNFAQYYKFKPEACPPYYPQAKGKVEAGVKYIRNNLMNGEAYNKTFLSVNELNKKLWRWLDKRANTRIHATTKERPIERWEREKQDLFQLFCRRHDVQKSLILTANEPFGKWDTLLLGNKARTIAAIDRLLKDCVAINIKGTSYRHLHVIGKQKKTST